MAGNIYRALSPRFGTLINFQVAEADEGDETPTGNGGKKAAALNEENAETKAAMEAEVNGENTNDTSSAANANANANPNSSNAPGTEPKGKVKPTVMAIENKAKPAVAKPAASPANDGRPRRTQPDQK